MNWMDRLTGGRHLRDTGIDWRDLWLPKPLAKLASPTRKTYKVINKQTNKQIHNSVTLQQPMVPLEIEIQSKLNIQGININAYILKFQNFMHQNSQDHYYMFCCIKYVIFWTLASSDVKSHSAHSFPKYMCMSKCEHTDIRKKKTTGKGKINPLL